MSAAAEEGKEEDKSKHVRVEITALLPEKILRIPWFLCKIKNAKCKKGCVIMITAQEAYLKKMNVEENVPVLEISYIVNMNDALPGEKHEFTSSEAIRRLKAKNTDLSGIIEQKQSELNKLYAELKQLQYTSAREIAALQAELEEQKQLVEEILQDNELLRQLNASLEERVDALDTAEVEAEESPALPNSYVQGRLKNLNVLIMGGHQVWQNRLKELYPDFKYLDSDNVNYDINITRNADIVFFNTLHCSHTLYYRMKNNINNGRMERKNKVIYISSNNLDYFKEMVSKAALGK